jgi:hypothetical protein
VDSDRERREAEVRREAELGRVAGFPAGVRGAGERRVEHASQIATREAARRGTREALEENEQEESGGGGLYGSQIDASHLVGAAEVRNRRIHVTDADALERLAEAQR